MIKTTEVINYSLNMKGIVKINNHDYEIPNVIKGEIVEVEYDPKNVKCPVLLKKIIKPDASRLNPLCKVSMICGGCNFNHLSYDDEIAIKTNWINQLYKHNFKFPQTIEVIKMDNPLYYRNKGQVALKPTKNGIIGGFYEEGTHNLINTNNCLIQDQIITNIQTKIQKILVQNHYQAYDEDKKRGIFRHILIKRSKATEEVLVVLVTSTDNFPGKNNLAKAIIREIPEVTTIIQNVNQRETSIILGEKEYVLYGPGFIFDKMNGYKFKITSKSFYQVNSLQTEKLYSRAITLANLNRDDILLDAYSGVGTIGILAAKKVKEVLSVELNKDAVKNGIQNAKFNNINNIRFYQDDATKYIIKAVDNKQHIDVVIMDPPRSGSTKEFLSSLIKLRPKKIIYVSCNPLTQVEDLKKLMDNYQIKDIIAVDMFPRTANIECIVNLMIKDK